jgi:nucleolar protein 56
LAERGFEELREKMLKSAKAGISKAYQSEEYALMQAVNAQIETSRSYNLAFERLSEWQGLYLPEIKMGNPKSLAKLVIELCSGRIDREAISEALGEGGKPDEVISSISSTMGRKMEEEEAAVVAGFAKQILSMADSLDMLDKYIKAAANRILPNTTYLTDHMIAAELLSRAGSLERLATMPAGTVQLLGAEKALFKHIKFGSRPPKYGILFKLSDVTNAQKEIKGKIARAYATKICIALKADCFSKNFIAEGLKKSLNESIKRIREKPITHKKEDNRNSFSRERNRNSRGFRGRGDRDNGFRKQRRQRY